MSGNVSSKSGPSRGSTLWRLSVTTTPEAEEAVGDLLTGLFSLPVCSFTDANTGRTLVSVYLPRHLDVQRGEIIKGLTRIRRAGLKIGSGRINFQKIKRADWAESWKRHFKPLEIGSTLLIKPSWSRRRARKGQAVVVLDPGLSFGTGHHPTTAFCLEQLVAAQKVDRKQSFLDIGTGSGILAIAAAKLGYEPVTAFDLDPDAVRIATSNSRRNRVARRMEIRQTDLAQLPLRGGIRHDVICANLIAPLLISEKNRLFSRMKADGRLVVAGITRVEFGEVRRVYEAAGLRLIASRAEKEWRSGCFCRLKHKNRYLDFE